jgi:hypothetical protein
MAQQPLPEVPGWRGDKRRDGAYLARDMTGAYNVFGKDQSWALTRCPCCDRMMLSDRAAKMVANIVHPMKVPTPPKDAA